MENSTTHASVIGSRKNKEVFAGSKTHQFTGGANLLSAVIVLAIMILPTVINISETSICAVHPGIKSASLALGATYIQTIFKSILPAAKSGVVTAVVLGVERAVGGHQIVLNGTK